MGANLSQEQKDEWCSKSTAHVLQYVKEKAPEFAEFIRSVGITGAQAMLFFKCGGPMAIATLFPTVGQDSAAPLRVKNFTPLSALAGFKEAAESPAVLSAISTLLTVAARAQQTHGDDVEQTTATANDAGEPAQEEVAAALDTLRSAEQKIRQVIGKEARARIHDKAILKECKKVRDEGNASFKAIYDSVWRYEAKDETGLTEYKEAVQQLNFPGAAIIQCVGSSAELLHQAAKCRPTYIALMTEMAAQCAEASFTAAAGLKKLGRIVEKAMLEPKWLGIPSRVFDVVRGMVVCPNLSTVARVIGLFSARTDITLVRGKERFVSEPSEGGWRDYLLCFHFNDPRLNFHVCEVQIVLDKLLVLRRNLPGHRVYHAVRNASELLDMPPLQGAASQLVQFYRAAKGNLFGMGSLPDGWNAKTSVQEWKGVEAEITEHGYPVIKQINMNRMRLHGRLSRVVGQLHHLRVLNVDDTGLQGAWR